MTVHGQTQNEYLEDKNSRGLKKPSAACAGASIYRRSGEEDSKADDVETFTPGKRANRFALGKLFHAGKSSEFSGRRFGRTTLRFVQIVLDKTYVTLEYIGRASSSQYPIASLKLRHAMS